MVWLQIRGNRTPFHQSTHEIQAKNETNSEGSLSETKLGFGFALRFGKSNAALAGHFLLSFYHAAITEPPVRDLIVVEVSSPTAKKVHVQPHNSFLDQRSRKVIV